MPFRLPQPLSRSANILLVVFLLAGCEPFPAAAVPPTAPLASPDPAGGTTAVLATPAPSLPPQPTFPPPTRTPRPAPTATPEPLTPLGLRRLWTWKATDILNDFLARDVDGDGQVDIVAGSYDRWLYRVDLHGQPAWDYDTGGSVFCLEAADLDGDGRDEILAGSEDGSLRAFGAGGELLWKVPLGGRVTAITTLDLDGDGRPEVLAGARPQGVTALSAEGSPLWQQDTPGAPTDFQAFGGIYNRAIVVSTEQGALLALDPAGAPSWQITGGGYVRQLAALEGGPLAGDRRGVLRSHTAAGEVILETSLGGSVAAVAAVDLDDDGRLEALAGVGGAESALLALDTSGEVRWRVPTERGVWSLAFPDLEGDGRPEVVAGTDGGEILVLDHWGRLRGHTFVPFRVHGLLAADLDGNGRDELLARASNHLYVFAGASEGDAGEQQPFVETLVEWPADTPLLSVGEDRVSLVAVGDVMIGRAVEPRMLVYGPTFPFAPLLPLLRDADITTGNLEGVLAYSGEPLLKSFTFRSHPALVDGLAAAGFDLMTLANNHAGDFGSVGLAETLAVLRDAGIEALGAGPQAYDPVVLEVRGLRVAFLGRNVAISPQEEVAWTEEAELRQAVAQAREQADLVVLHLHAGVEYAPNADETQRLLARAAAEAGADLVIGHHSHAPQEVEWIGSTLVAYSLGDFVFDIDDHDIARDGVVLRVILSAEGVVGAEWIPVRIVDDVQPRPRAGSDGRPIVQTIP